MPVRSSIPLRRKKGAARTYLSRTRVTRSLGIKKGKRVKYITPFTQPKGSTAQFVDLPPDVLRLIGQNFSGKNYKRFRAVSKQTRSALLPIGVIRFEEDLSDSYVKSIRYAKQNEFRDVFLHPKLERYYLDDYDEHYYVPRKIGEQILKRKGFHRASSDPYSADYDLWIRPSK